MQKRWVIKASEAPEKVSQLANDLKISDSIAQMLLQRGINTFDEAKQFFRPQLSDLHDPFLMQDMDAAVARIETAIDKGEKILVFGDYDVDGTTAVSLMYSFLSTIYDQLDYYIPDRYTEGYGISLKGIDYATDNQFALIIALDCGVKANDKITYANERSIDFIICDHHRPGETLPEAVAVLDPKREDCNYPYDELSGCGIGFKLAQAIAAKRNIPFDDLLPYFDLLAVSIASDIVPITGENRVLAFHGLKRINEQPRKGIKAILELANKLQACTITDLVFIIGPRINAAGRIESGMKAVELLISDNDGDASTSGQLIDLKNTERRNLDKEITEQALAILREDGKTEGAKTTVLYNENWHKGVIGIVASRLIESYYRPTVVLTESNGMATGSARSVKGFDVYNAIHSCHDLLDRFGGHKYAAGLTMKLENIPEFQRRFEEEVAATIDEELLTPEITIDAEVELSDIRNSQEEIPKFYRILKQLAPFGPGNMKPTFVSKNVVDTGYCKIVGDNHLKLTVTHKSTPTIKISAIAFNMGEHYHRISRGDAFDVVYVIEENEWQNRISLQLRVKDIRFED
jgi:single-stranded-DNA-specific exonuclease